MPAADIQWATDTNFTNGPDIGTPTKVTPSAGVKAEGHVPGTALPAQRLNWHLNAIGVEIKALEESITYPTPVARTTSIPISLAVTRTQAGVPDFDRGATGWTAAINGAILAIPMPRLPDGAVITSIDVIVNPAAARAGANRMAVEIFSEIFNSSNPSLSSIAYDSGATGAQTVTVTPTATLTVDNETRNYRVQVTSGLTSTVTDGVLYARVNWNDPGLVSGP